MAQNEDIDEEEQLNNKDATKESREAAKALDSMTDIVPEKQIDENKAAQAIHALKAAQQADKEAARQREKELAAVKINKDDVDVIATEMEVDKKLAERRLREHGGDLAAALKSFF